MLSSSNQFNNSQYENRPSRDNQRVSKWGKKIMGNCSPDHTAFRRKLHQDDSGDFLCCPVTEVEALLIRSYFMCEHTEN